jgi:NTE family protein
VTFSGLFSLFALGALVLSGCGGSPHGASPPERRTCVVLSIGGDRGIAHLGALAAAKERGISVQCVVGNSMGALVGSLYATEPQADTTARYRELMARYVAATEAEAHDRAVVGALLGAGLALLSGGAALPLMAGGGFVGAGSVDPQDLTRFRQVLDGYYRHASIEQLPVSFATMHQRVRGENGGMVDVRTGNVAGAVGASIANPLIFPRFDPRVTGVLDPGVDRVAATPVDDACRLFPDARLLVVNASGKPVFVSTRMNCPVLEIDVPSQVANAPRVLIGKDPDFSAVVKSGYAAATHALEPSRVEEWMSR